VEDNQAGDESSYSVTSWSPQGGVAVSDSEKAEALADTLETQFQPVADPGVPAVIEMVDVAMKSYFYRVAVLACSRSERPFTTELFKSRLTVTDLCVPCGDLRELLSQILC
jgi:uncharacterized protein (DUF1786 family)